MTVLIFFFTFLEIVGRKWFQQGDPKKYCFCAFGVPERTKIASATRPRLFIDFPSILDPIFIDFWYFWDPFWVAFMLVRRFRRFPNTYPLILFRRFPLRGAAVCAPRSQLICCAFGYHFGLLFLLARCFRRFPNT